MAKGKKRNTRNSKRSGRGQTSVDRAARVNEKAFADNYLGKLFAQILDPAQEHNTATEVRNKVFVFN